jgi:hypothetical protein
MTDASTSPVLRHAGSCAGSGSAAPGVTGWLALAATPVFALMALLTGLSGGAPDLLCMAMQGSSPLSGMPAMYLLMSALHLSPWLRLIAGTGRA